MGRRKNTNDAAEKDAQILPSREECAKSMGQREYAASKVVQIKSSREECA
jgi:hypothetical protein